MDVIRERITDALLTARALNGAGWEGPTRSTTTWPRIVRDVAISYGWQNSADEVFTPPPTIKQTEEMDEVLGWLRWLYRRERIVITGQIAGAPDAWLARHIQRDQGRRPYHRRITVADVRRWERQGLRRIRRRLAATGLNEAEPVRIHG